MEININGALLNLNVFEANQAQRLVESYKYVAEEAEKAQGKSLPEQINIQCEAVKVAFDSVFGEGAGTAVCGYENDLMKCVDAYTRLCEEKDRQEQMMNEKTNRLLSMYADDQKQVIEEKVTPLLSVQE